MGMKHNGWTDQQIEQVKQNILPEGKNYAQCSYFCRKHLNQGFRPIKSNLPENNRGLEFAKMHNSGMSYADISEKVGLSRQRIAVIVKTWESRNKE